jgi:hypothetical protein
MSFSDPPNWPGVGRSPGDQGLEAEPTRAVSPDPGEIGGPGEELIVDVMSFSYALVCLIDTYYQ